MTKKVYRIVYFLDYLKAFTRSMKALINLGFEAKDFAIG